MSTLPEMAHALRALDPVKRKRDPIGTATLTLDDVELVASYSYQRNIDPSGFDVFDVTLTVKASEGLLDAVRNEIAFRLREEATSQGQARADEGPDEDEPRNWRRHGVL